MFHKSIYLDFIYFVHGLECFPWLPDFGVPSECFPVIVWDSWALPNTRRRTKYHLAVQILMHSVMCTPTNWNRLQKLATHLLMFKNTFSHSCMMAIPCHFGTSLYDLYISTKYFVFCILSLYFLLPMSLFLFTVTFIHISPFCVTSVADTHMTCLIMWVEISCPIGC